VPQPSQLPQFDVGSIMTVISAAWAESVTSRFSSARTSMMFGMPCW
jgi:hypothetical protein